MRAVEPRRDLRRGEQPVRHQPIVTDARHEFVLELGCCGGGLLRSVVEPGTVDHLGLGDRAVHDPVVPSVDRQVAVVVARSGRVGRPRLHHPVRSGERSRTLRTCRRGRVATRGPCTRVAIAASSLRTASEPARCSPARRRCRTRTDRPRWRGVPFVVAPHGQLRVGLSGSSTQPPRTISPRSAASNISGPGCPYAIGTTSPRHSGQRSTSLTVSARSASDVFMASV